MAFGVNLRTLLAAAGIGGAAGPWDVIESTTLGSAAASVSFASIDSKYRLLRVTAYIVKDGTAADLRIRINNDAGANYDYQKLEGNDTSVSAARGTGIDYIPAGNLQIGSNSNGTYSFVIAKQVSGSAAMVLGQAAVFNTNVFEVNFAARWNNTAAVINRIDLYATSNFAAGTVVVLEGIPD